MQRGAIKAENSEFDLPLAGEHSEWAELAVLRTGLDRQVAVSGRQLSAGDVRQRICRRSALCLAWSLPSRTACRRRARWMLTGSGPSCVGRPTRIWTTSNWRSRLTKNWRLQRQFLLARQDQFLFTADVLLGPRTGQLDYRLELPLDPAVTWQRDEDTTEVQWMRDKPLAWVFPLALSEWRMDSRHGKFDGRVLYQTASGTALYAPLFVDFSAKRQR